MLVVFYAVQPAPFATVQIGFSITAQLTYAWASVGGGRRGKVKPRLWGCSPCNWPYRVWLYDSSTSSNLNWPCNAVMRGECWGGEWGADGGIALHINIWRICNAERQTAVWRWFGVIRRRILGISCTHRPPHTHMHRPPHTHIYIYVHPTHTRTAIYR